jgi:hypothetical protein
MLSTMTHFTKGLGSVVTDPAKGMTQMSASIVKGTLVEVPTAMAEGLRNIPRLYGEQVEKTAPINSWKSGMTEAGRVR